MATPVQELPDATSATAARGGAGLEEAAGVVAAARGGGGGGAAATFFLAQPAVNNATAARAIRVRFGAWFILVLPYL